MNELEEIFTGLKRHSAFNEDHVVMTARDFLVFTRLFHSSVGPRMGNLLEEFIEEWLSDEGYVVVRNSTLKGALQRALSVWQDRWGGDAR